MSGRTTGRTSLRLEVIGGVASFGRWRLFHDHMCWRLERRAPIDKHDWPSQGWRGPLLRFWRSVGQRWRKPKFPPRLYIEGSRRLPTPFHSKKRKRASVFIPQSKRGGNFPKGRQPARVGERFPPCYTACRIGRVREKMRTGRLTLYLGIGLIL